VDESSETTFEGVYPDRVNRQGAAIDHVDYRGARLRAVDFSGALFRGAEFVGARFIGAEFVDVEINGDVSNVLVNGVDVAPLVEAELNRRMPERAKMHPENSDGFREAWGILERRWAETISRARTFPEESLNRRVDEEWSFIQTLRHLNFAVAAWVNRMVLGDPAPYHALDLPWEEASELEGVTWDPAARPSLEEVLEVRRERDATVREVMLALTDEQLSATVTRREPGWPQLEDFPVRRCLWVVLNEEWEHRLFAERDLTALEHGAGR
jgi:uncharacterized protein YjbI with pentapeptide repeats